MINGLYSGASALNVLSQKQEMISANLAHVNSGGHRKIAFAVEQIPGDAKHGPVQGYGPQTTMQIDFSPGRVHHTGRSLDVAINGDAFFVVQDQGAEFLTRNGRFYRNPETSELVTSAGMTVLGEQGAIRIDPSIGDNEISVASNGTISGNGRVLGKLLQVAVVDNQQLNAVNQSLFSETATSQRIESPQATITQFAQEMSNTSPVAELMSLIITSRQFEAIQKATRAIAESLQSHIRA